VGDAAAEIRCQPGSEGVELTFIAFGSRAVMDGYTSFLQQAPDGIRISSDAGWKYEDDAADTGHKIEYYHPGADTSQVYWTYAQELMGVVAVRSGTDEAALHQWWIGVDVLN
jgi:hypothetical protein